MTLKQLESFYWISRLGTFAAAAERLNTTQSSVSMRIRQLEADLGIDLFERGPRNNRLTLHGEEVLVFAQSLLNLVSEMHTRIGQPQAVVRTIRLGVGELIVVSWLSKLLAAVNDAYPRLTVDLEIDLTLNQLRKLRAGELDLALLPAPKDMTGLVGIPLGNVKFAWMASPKLALPAGRLVPQDLAKLPLITLTQHAHSHALLGEWFAQHGVDARSRSHANSMSVLLTLTLAGLGASFLPISPLTNEHVAKGNLRILKVGGVPQMTFNAMYERGRADPFIASLALVAAKHSTFAGRRAAPTRVPSS